MTRVWNLCTINAAWTRTRREQQQHQEKTQRTRSKNNSKQKQGETCMRKRRDAQRVDAIAPPASSRLIPTPGRTQGYLANRQRNACHHASDQAF